MAGRHGHVADHCGGGDQGIAPGSRVGHKQGCTPLHHGGVHRQHMARNGRQHMLIQPSPEQGVLLGVAALHQQHAGFQFQDGNGGKMSVLAGTLDARAAKFRSALPALALRGSDAALVSRTNISSDLLAGPCGPQRRFEGDVGNTRHGQPEHYTHSCPPPAWKRRSSARAGASRCFTAR
jgi:hypothetical protein